MMSAEDRSRAVLQNATLDIGVLGDDDHGKSPPVFRSICQLTGSGLAQQRAQSRNCSTSTRAVRPRSVTVSVGLTGPRRSVEFSFGSTVQRLTFDVNEVRLLIALPHHLIFCFTSVPRASRTTKRSNRTWTERCVDSSFGGLLYPEVLTTCRAYSVGLEHSSSSQLKLLVETWKRCDDSPRVVQYPSCTTIHCSEEDYTELVDKNKKHQASLCHHSFELAYDMECLLSSNIIHPFQIAAFAGILLTVSPAIACSALHLLPKKHKESQRKQLLPPPYSLLYATGDLLRQCIALVSDGSAICIGSTLSTGNTRDDALTQDSDAKASSSYISCRRVYITPLAIRCIPAHRDLSNRVIRHFWHARDRFLRVRFTDESLKFLTKGKAVLKRVHGILKNGFDLCNRRYELLAFSASQVRLMWPSASLFKLLLVVIL